MKQGKFRLIKTGIDSDGLGFWCPGCKETHMVTVKGPRTWAFNNDYNKPTFSPSILVTGVQQLTEAEYTLVMAGVKIEPIPTVCHSFINNGVIQFLSDCTHELAGKNVDLPDLPEHMSS